MLQHLTPEATPLSERKPGSAAEALEREVAYHTALISTESRGASGAIVKDVQDLKWAPKLKGKEVKFIRKNMERPLSLQSEKMRNVEARNRLQAKLAVRSAARQYLQHLASRAAAASQDSASSSESHSDAS